MSAKELGNPGFLENSSFVLRNVEMVAAGIVLLAGYPGAAAMLGVASAFDHAAGEYFKSKRVSS